jgi:hypothetical protein
LKFVDMNTQKEAGAFLANLTDRNSPIMREERNMSGNEAVWITAMAPASLPSVLEIEAMERYGLPPCI